MKSRTIVLFACLFLFTCAVLSQTQFSFAQYVVINTSTTTPIQLTNSSLRVRSVTILGKKAFQTTNTTAINIGVGSATDGLMGITVDPGLSVTFKSIDGRASFALSNLWLDVTTANDGAVVYWEP